MKWHQLPMKLRRVETEKEGWGLKCKKGMSGVYQM